MFSLFRGKMLYSKKKKKRKPVVSETSLIHPDGYVHVYRAVFIVLSLTKPNLVEKIHYPISASFGRPSYQKNYTRQKTLTSTYTHLVAQNPNGKWIGWAMPLKRQLFTWEGKNWTFIRALPPLFQMWLSHIWVGRLSEGKFRITGICMEACQSLL